MCVLSNCAQFVSDDFSIHYSYSFQRCFCAKLLPRCRYFWPMLQRRAKDPSTFHKVSYKVVRVCVNRVPRALDLGTRLSLYDQGVGINFMHFPSFFPSVDPKYSPAPIESGLIEGDFKLTDKQKVNMKLYNNIYGPPARAASGRESERWPGAIIPYVFDCSVSK